MNLKLHTFIHKNISSWDLIDPSFKPTPEKNNPWALWCAGVVDWLLAILITKVCVSSWLTFMTTLGLNALPSQALEMITLKAKGIEVVLMPLIFMTIHFTSLLFHSKTFGQKLFKHHVQFTSEKSLWYYTLALMVSPVLMGIPLLNSWIDEFSKTQTVSKEFSYFQFSFLEESFIAPHLIESLELETQTDEFNYQDAA